MKKILLSLFLSCSIYGCTNSENTFNLVCKGKEDVYMRVKVNNKEDFTQGSSDSTRTFIFVNKLLDNYECTKFDEKEIYCQKNSKNIEKDRFTETFNEEGISINRI